MGRGSHSNGRLAKPSTYLYSYFPVRQMAPSGLTRRLAMKCHRNDQSHAPFRRPGLVVAFDQCDRDWIIPATHIVSHPSESHGPDGPCYAFEVPGEELGDGIDLVVVATLGECGKFGAQVVEPWRALGEMDVAGLDPR